MVFVFALSAKWAITLSAVIGGGVGLYINRDKVVDYFEQEWMQRTREHAPPQRICPVFTPPQEGSRTDEESKFSDNELSTPDASEMEGLEDWEEWSENAFTEEKGQNSVSE